MTTAPDIAPPALPALDYSRTVDRLLVHRDALGEVFLTDLRPVNDTVYAAGAQLPRSHAYYGDHLLRPSCHDPLLILEACRQAALAGAHRFFGVPPEDKFILTHLRLRLDQPHLTHIGTTPFRLAMRLRIASRKERGDQVIGLDYEIDLYVDDALIGTAAIGLRFKTPNGYLTLRLNNRDGMALPSSAGYPAATPGAPLTPHLVGRANPDNVLLLDGVVLGESAQALLRIPARHASLFDHPQDHLPGMVIAEGARQLALFAALELQGVAPSKTLVTSLDVTFARFGELEHDTVLSATVQALAEDGTTDSADYTLGGVLAPRQGAGTTFPVHVEATQKGELLCTFDLVLNRMPA